MSYKITIEETKTETKMVKGRWTQVKGDPEADYGYADDREEEVSNTVKVYEQIVNDVDIVGVIDAVNSRVSP